MKSMVKFYIATSIGEIVQNMKSMVKGNCGKYLLH